LWIGDILYLYGFCGMIVYLLRKVNPIYLAMAVPIVAVLDFTSSTVFYQHIRTQRIGYVQATAAEAAGESLSESQIKAVAQWRVIEKSLIPNRDDVKENTLKMKSDYSTVAGYLRPLAFQIQTILLPFMLFDSLALMMLGIALYRWGFFSGEWSNATYQRVLIIGYVIGLPMAMYSYYDHFLHEPTLEASLARMEKIPIVWIGILYPFQRILLVMAHASTVILLYKSGYAKRLFRCLESVGQMAFTNYIMQSVICTLFFFGYGLNYYGELQFYQLYLVAWSIWVIQLIVSPLWLSRFRFGPLEWVWRSLTYWKLQKI
jgi:uncharacterized protein